MGDYETIEVLLNSYENSDLEYVMALRDEIIDPWPTGDPTINETITRIFQEFETVQKNSYDDTRATIQALFDDILVQLAG